MKKLLCKLLILSILALPYSLPARASMIGTADALAPAHAERATVVSFLARSDVQRDLAAFGVSPTDAQERVVAMTDDEVRSLAGNVDSAPAGGIIGILLIILLVVVIVKVAGR